jgi:hypothetical protein
MAVTYLQQPGTGTFQSSDNPIVFVFSSNQTTQPNFSFVVDTLLNGVIVSTDEVYPERGTRAHIDVMKTTLSSVKVLSRPTALATMQDLPTLQIRVSERYGTVPVTYSFAQSNICKVMKAACPEEDYQLGWIAQKYTPDTKWLTDAPDSTLVLRRDAPIWASILNTSPACLVEVYAKDADGETIGVLTSNPQTGKDLIRVRVTPAELLAAISPLPLSSVHRLEMYMNQSNALHVLYADEDCGEFNQVSWINNLGAYDQFLFTHNREDESAISMLEYKKQFGAWDSGSLFSFDSTKSGDTTYLKKIQPTGTLFSGWMAEKNRHWLNELLYSVDVLVVQGTQAEKIVPTETQALEPKARFEDVINFQVKYKKTNFRSITI